MLTPRAPAGIWRKLSEDDAQPQTPQRGAGFAVFIKNHCQRIRTDNPEASVPEIRRILCNEWLQMTPAERRVWRASPAMQGDKRHQLAEPDTPPVPALASARRVSPSATKSSPPRLVSARRAPQTTPRRAVAVARPRSSSSGRAPLTPLTSEVNVRAGLQSAVIARTPVFTARVSAKAETPPFTPMSEAGDLSPTPPRAVSVSKRETVILVDWDDTLMCTYDLIERRQLDIDRNQECGIPRAVQMQLKALEVEVCNFLVTATKYGSVQLVRPGECLALLQLQLNHRSLSAA
jgi:hypothetical protein